MFGLFRQQGPVLAGTAVMLRLPARGDHAAWAALRAQSRAEIQPFEPRWPEHELSRARFQARVTRSRQMAEDGTAYAFLVFERRGAPLLGGITLSNIRRGASQSAQVGYWLGTPHCGQGYMTDALVTLMRFAFGSLRLHRLEAASIAGNQRSIALLTRCGFRREGTAREHLEIDGRRQDHELFACLSSDAGFAPVPPRREG